MASLRLIKTRRAWDRAYVVVVGENKKNVLFYISQYKSGGFYCEPPTHGDDIYKMCLEQQLEAERGKVNPMTLEEAFKFGADVIYAYMKLALGALESCSIDKVKKEKEKYYPSACAMYGA